MNGTEADANIALEPGVKLSRALRGAFYGSFATLLITGVGWYALTDGRLPFNINPDFDTRRMTANLLAIHGAAAMLALITVGALLPRHMARAWKARVNRFTGIVMIAGQAVLLATGYMLYYVGDDRAREAAELVHLVVGICFPALVIWHVVAGRRAARLGPSDADSC